MIIRRLFLVLGLLSICGICRAETLNLDQAISRALEHDPRIEEVQHLVGSANALEAQAEGHRDWMFDVNAFLGFSPSVKGDFFENGGCDPAHCQVRSDAYNFNSVSLWTDVTFAAIKPLNTFGKIKSYSEAARAYVQVKEGDVRLQRGSTMMDVKRAYYGYLAARDTYLVLEDTKKRVDGMIDMVQQWLKDNDSAHDIRQSDLYALQAGSAMLARYMAESDALEQVALDGLKVLTGVGLGNELTVADDDLHPLPLPDMDLAKLEDQALTQRPEIAQVEAGLRARRALVEATKAEAKPNLYTGVIGLVSYSPNRDSLNNPYIVDPFNDVGFTPVIGLKWDWQRGVQRAEVAQNEAELNALIAKSAEAREGIPFQVAEAYHQVKAQHEEMVQLEEAARDSRRWMVASFSDFEAGLEKGDKVVTALQGYVLAHTDYLKTMFDYNMEIANLQNVTGADQ